METYVALLRGVNVGGKNKLPMADLVRICREAGCQDVKTYIQSGNVVCRSEAPERELATRIAAGIEAQAGLRVPVVVRTRAELAAVSSHPLEAEPDLVMFLADAPGPEALARLDPARSPGDTYLVRGREVFLRCGRGLADTRLTNDYFDRTLRTTSTGRNWRTVQKLLELARGL